MDDVEANHHYAYIHMPDGRETSVSVHHLAPGEPTGSKDSITSNDSPESSIDTDNRIVETTSDGQNKSVHIIPVEKEERLNL